MDGTDAERRYLRMNVGALSEARSTGYHVGVISLTINKRRYTRKEI